MRWISAWICSTLHCGSALRTLVREENCESAASCAQAARTFDSVRTFMDDGAEGIDDKIDQA